MVSVIFLPKRKLSKYLGLVAILTIIVIPAYADQVIKATSGGTLNVGFSTDPNTPNPGDQTQFKINFLKGTAVQPHIDYKVAIMEGNNQICGTPILHTAEGSITIPCMLPDAATYRVIVEVDGILFQPIPPETAAFTVTVGSTSLPPGTNQTTTNNATGTIKIPNWVRNNAKWWSQGQIDDVTFAAGIQYMIKTGIIIIPPTQSGHTSSGVSIPMWVKNNAGWWSKGQIDDATFVAGIQYLVKVGIIQV